MACENGENSEIGITQDVGAEILKVFRERYEQKLAAERSQGDVATIYKFDSGILYVNGAPTHSPVQRTDLF